MVEKTQTSGFWPSLYEPLRQVGARLAEWVAPASEASMQGDAYRIAIELPGVKEEDIDLTVNDDVLTVKGTKKSDIEEHEGTWFFSERQYGAFSRSFRLPPDADGDTAKADLKDGVLSVTIAKKKNTSAEGAKKVPISKG